MAGVNGTGTGAGSIAWHVPTPEPPLLSGTIATNDTFAFFYRTGRTFVALRLADQKIAWTAMADESFDNAYAMRGVIVCGNRVLFGSQAAMYAYSPASGERLWRWAPSAAGQLDYASPSCANDTVIVTTGRPMRVYAVDAQTGAQFWITPFGDSSNGIGFLTSPAISEGIAVMCSREFGPPFRGAVSAFRISSGAVLWRYTWTPPPPQVDASCSERVRIANGIAVATVDDGRLFGLDLRSGALQWTAAAVDGFVTPGDERSIIVSDFTVVAGSLSGRLMAYDSRSGALRWNVVDARSALSIFNYGLVADRGEIIGVNLSGWIASYDASTGTRRWAVSRGVGVNERVFLAEGVALSRDFALGRANDGIYAIRR